MKNIFILCAVTCASWHAAATPCSSIYVFNQLDKPVQVNPFATLGGQPMTVEPGQTVTYSASSGKTLAPFITFGMTSSEGKYIFIAPHIEPTLLLNPTTLAHNDYVTLARDERGRYRITYAQGAYAWPTFACYINQTTAKSSTNAQPTSVCLADALDEEYAQIARQSISSLHKAAAVTQRLACRM